MEITEEQRKRAQLNRLAALAKRKQLADTSFKQDPWKLFKCRKISPDREPPLKQSSCTDLPVQKPQIPAQLANKFRVRLEICSPDSFSVTPMPVQGSPFPGEAACLEKLRDCLSNIVPSHYTQNTGGGKACVYNLRDYDAVLRCLKIYRSAECEEIPWSTFNVIQKLSNSFTSGRWIPCRPEHLSDENVDELIERLPKSLVDALLPFQREGVRFGLRRGGRCLIADEMGLGKTLQAIAIAGCFLNEGSTLVVCPAILRYAWAEEFEHWLPTCLPSDIHLVFGHQNNPARLAKCPRVVVTSYTMLKRLRKGMLERDWAVLIVDESHHVRCSKKSSESEEIKAVLDVAIKAKHTVLLTGTPSLSRPYDIFHQINMLWPGLLGKDKYEFAKTYCAVSSFHGVQGKLYKDFSKGVRLEELNVLLQQTVMIRRLKEHVMLQLPPKRRQIISLLLKKSDVDFAKGVVTKVAEGDDGSTNDDAEDGLVDIPVECNVDCCKSSSRKLSDQEIGIAKLSGFRQWLSIHPIIAELDVEDDNETSLPSHKMIVFAHHHKVLDAVQEFLCEKGIEFVRIDGTTFERDRQLAVQSFQSSKQIKIALIGILAGGSGLNLSAAQNVVFLELPKDPAHLLQAEDRAHRRGQTKAVNIYIFCAKDSPDESLWRKLNKSLHRVSSTVNGKYDAIKEIEIESVSYFGTTGETDKRSENPIMERASSSGLSTVELMEIPSTCIDQNLQTDQAFVPLDEENNQRYDIQEHSDVHETTDLNNGEYVRLVEADSSSSLQISHLRFEVSQYTGRIHLYACVPGVDLRPRPLFENFRPEELESPHPPPTDESKKIAAYKCIKDDPRYRRVLTEFIKEWNNLRPIEQKKLLAKPLQLPLSVELCCLNESLNHGFGGLLKGKSKKRSTPFHEISHPLPSDATWRKINLHSGRGKKGKEYEQGWTMLQEPLCKLCQTPCKGNNAKTPEYFEDLFCNLSCYEEYRLRTSNEFLREGLFQIEHGICTSCQLDCHKLVVHLRPLSCEKREEYIKKVAPELVNRPKLLKKLVQEPTEGNAWHADHIVPVYLGGGECTLENMRTLCVVCHANVTAAQCADRRSTKRKAKKQLKALMSDLKDNQNLEQNKDLIEESVADDDDLLIDIPGSAYSNISNGKQEEHEKSVL